MILLDLLEAFNIIQYSIFLDHLKGLGMIGTCKDLGGTAADVETWDNSNNSFEWACAPLQTWDYLGFTSPAKTGHYGSTRMEIAQL